MSKHWDFEVVIEESYMNINCIHPLKQRDLCEIVKVAEQDEHIKEIIVFGSSVRFDCNSYSDIDIYVRRDGKLFKSPVDYDKVQSDVDVIYNHTCGQKLFNEITQTGVTIFRR